MVRKTNVRTVVNRQALTDIRAKEVDAMEALGQRFLEVVRPPDAPPLGQGLVQTGDWGVWADGKKVAGTAPKPRSVRVKQYGVILIAGFGFPARFNEIGTIRQPPRPFVTPAFQSTIGGGQHIAAFTAAMRNLKALGGKRLGTKTKGLG